MSGKNRNFFRVTRFLLFTLPPLFRFLSKFRKPQQRLLIIKADAIGDYILFRNFIKIVKQSATFKDYTIDLLGNKLWQDIALKYDRQFVDEFIFTEPERLYHTPLQTLKLAWRLFKGNYQTVLQPTYARTLITDGLAAFTAAGEIIGFGGDCERISTKYKSKTDRFYTQLIELSEGIIFESEKSKFYFETVLKEPVTFNGPVLERRRNGNKSGIVICPGAGVFKRSWDAEKFVTLISLILRHTSGPVQLAGGPADVETGTFIMDNLPAGSVDNLIGKTSLLQLVELIGNAKLVIANETSAVHIAAAVQTPAVCILGGGHFERFAPYPAYMLSRPVCVYEKLECYSCNWNCIFQMAETEPYPCISIVTAEKVWEQAANLLAGK